MTARIVCLWLLVLLAAGEGQASPRPYDIPRPAGKRLADLQSGDPRTVRLVHFRPNDRPLRVEALAQLREMALKTQDFFAGQMEAHGFGRRTFRLETDGEGEPVVHQIEGRHPDSHYPADPHGVVFSEIGQVFNTRANVYLVLIDNSQGGRPRAVSTGKIGGQAAVFPSHTWRTAAHELGHAFGLDHDFRDGAYIMSYGSRPDRMSLCAAEYLSVHPLFNPAVPTGPGAAPSVELLSELEYPKGATTFAIDIEVSDPDGLHHLIVTMDTEGLHPAAGYPEVKACHSFDGRTEAVVEMEFDDDTPSYFASVSRRIHVKVLDTDGNVVKASYTLLESSAYKIASLQIDDHLVRSLAFSPDGTLLAAAGSGETELWDVDRRVLVRSLWGGDAVAFSPDGGALAAGYGPGAALIQDLETGRPTFFDGHNDFITSVAFSPDGRLLAVGARDGTLKLWDAASKPASLWSANEHPLFTLEGHAARITSLYFSRDSARLVSFSSSGNGARLWDVATGALTATLPPEGARWWIRAVALDPKGGILACASNDGRIRLLDVVSGEQLAVMRGSGWRLSFSPDGGILAASALDQTIHLWDVFAREEIAVFASGEVHALAFSPDGRILALAGNDGRFGLWDMSEWAGPRPRTLTKISGDLQQAPPGADLEHPYVVEVRDQHGDPLPGARVAFRVLTGGGYLGERYTVVDAVTGPDGRARMAFALGPDPGANTVTASVPGIEVAFRATGVGEAPLPEFHYPTWNLPAAATVRLGRGEVGQRDRAVTFSPGGERLAVASAVGVWLYDTGDPERFLLLPAEEATTLSFSPDGTRLVVGSGQRHGSLSLWDPRTGEQIEVLYDGWWVNYVSFSPDGKRIAFGAGGPDMQLWDAETGRPVSVKGSTPRGVAAAFSPDGKVLASGGEGGRVRLWDTETGANTVLEGHSDIVNSVAFSPDGATLVSASGDGTVGVWDVASGDRTGTFHGHGAHVLSVSYSPRGNLVASGGLDGSVMVWHEGTQRSIGTFSGHEGMVWAVAFSPDGEALASASADGTVALWDLTTRGATVFSGHAALPQNVVFSPDGTRLAHSSLSHDGRVHLWDVDTGREIVTLSAQRWHLNRIAFSPDGGTLATVSVDHTVVIWDLAAYVPLVTLEEERPVTAVCFSPDGRSFAWGTDDGTIRLRDLDTEAEITLSGIEDRIRVMAFSPDGRTLAGGSQSGGLIVWNLATGAPAAVLGGHPGAIVSLDFSADGTTLSSSSGGGERQIIVWDVATGTAVAREERKTPETPEWLGPVAISPDGSLFATRWEGVLLGDVGTGQVRATLQDTPVHLVLFSPDGSLLASAERNGLIILWDVKRALPHPRTLTGLSGNGQEGPPGAVLNDPFVLEVRDQHGDPLDGVVVTWAIVGDGRLVSTVQDTTDGKGQVATRLTLGEALGTYTVTATVDELEPVTFAATARATPDFDGDGVTGLSDFFLFAEAFGGSDPRFDLDASGSVDFADFFLFAESFGPEERARLASLARDRIGLPEDPQLRNAPNPFNSQTVITWFQMRAGPARLEVYSLTGQRVAVVHDGILKAGLHRLRWHGRDGRGHALASGVYVYRLVTAESVQTRKLTLLR